MKPLSPVDALSPAFRRTGAVFGEPFRFWFFIKIALIAALTQSGMYSAMFSYPMQALQFGALGRMPHRQAYPPYGNSFAAGPGDFHAAGIMLIVFAALTVVGLVFWVGMTYLYCRLRFMLFDLVVYQQGRVGLAWSKYGRQTWRFLGLLVLVILVFLLVAAVTVGPAFLHFFVRMRGMDPQVFAANPFAVFGNMLPLIGACILLGLLWGIADAIMQDFLLPPLAVENAPLESSFRRFFTLLRSSFGSVLVYLLLRFVIGIALVWALFLIGFIAFALLALGAAGVGFLLYHALWHAGLGGHTVFFAYVAAAGLLLLALYLLLLVSIYGIAAVFKQSYAAYFFGSHYPELGNRLEPPEEELVGALVTPPLPSMPPLQEPPPVW